MALLHCLGPLKRDSGNFRISFFEGFTVRYKKMIDFVADGRVWVLFFTAGESSSSAERDRTTDESREPLKGFARRRRVRQKEQRFTKPFQNNRGFHLKTNTFGSARTMRAITLGAAVAIISAQLSAASLSIALVSDQLSPSALVLKNAAGKLLRADRGDQAASFMGRFAWELPPGKYQLVGYVSRFPTGMGLPALDQYKPARSYPDALGWFSVTASTAATLHFNTSGTLGLVTALDASSDKRKMPMALQFLQDMHELPDGRWAVIAADSTTQQKVLVADQNGHWRLHAKIAMLRPLAIASVGDQFVISGEAGELILVGADGASSKLSSEGLPSHSLLLPRCNREFQCALVALTDSRNATFFHTTDARKGGWQKRSDQVQTNGCGWNMACNVVSQTFAANEVVFAITSKKQLQSIDVATGVVESHPFKFGLDTIVTTGAQIWVGDHTSTDRGKTWQRSATPPRATDGAEYRLGSSFGLRAWRPMIDRRASGGKWVEHAKPPSYGTYLVGTKTDRQYFLTGNDLQVSTDRGKTWQPDTSFYHALMVAAPTIELDNGNDQVQLPNADTNRQKTVLLMDRSVANLRTTFRIPYVANQGLIINMMAANDEQVLKDELLASMRQCMDETRVGEAIAEGIRDVMDANGYPSSATIIARASSQHSVSRIKAQSKYVVLITGGAENKYGNNTPTGISLDHRQVRVNFQMQLIKRLSGDTKRIWARDVTVFSNPVDLKGPSSARQAWCANDGVALHATLTSIAGAAMKLAFGKQDEIDVGKQDFVDVLTELGADRLPGKLVSFDNQRALIRDHDQRIYSVPALQVW
jgi:hypothetical protein